MRIRVGAGNGNASKATAVAFSSCFYISLDFELLVSHMPYYHSALGDRLEYELTFNDYGTVQATGYANASFDIKNICLEYMMVAHPELALMIANQYHGRLAILKMTIDNPTPSGTSSLTCPPAA